MSATNESHVMTLKANGAVLSGTLVKLDSTVGQCVPATAATDIVIGVANIDAISGQSVAVVTSNIARVKIGGTVTVGDKLTATT